MLLNTVDFVFNFFFFFAIEVCLSHSLSLQTRALFFLGVHTLLGAFASEGLFLLGVFVSEGLFLLGVFASEGLIGTGGICF